MLLVLLLFIEVYSSARIVIVISDSTPHAQQDWSIIYVIADYILLAVLEVTETMGDIESIMSQIVKWLMR